MLAAPQSVQYALEEEEEEMQCRITTNGPWHRLSIDRKKLACGDPVPLVGAAGYPPYGSDYRRPSYDLPLCDRCFTVWELSEASKLARKKRLTDGETK